MRMNKLAPSVGRITASAFAFAGCLTLSARGDFEPMYGDFAILPDVGEAGSLSVSGELTASGFCQLESGLLVMGDITGGNIGAAGGIDFGYATSVVNMPGVTLQYLGTSEHDAAFDLTDSLGSFLWRDNAGATVRPKMKLSTDNILSLYNSAGSAATITLQGGSGQIHLTGTGSGIYSGGTPVFSLTSGGALEYGSTRPVSILNASAASAFSGALRIEGGFAARKDSYVSDLRIGMGNNSVSQNTAFGREALNANTTGNNNTAIGMVALRNNTSGQANTAVGSFALQAHTSGEYNAAFGASAMGGNTTGSYNSAFGKSALNLNTTANSNSAFGYEAMRVNTTGAGNSAVGRYALYSNTVGNFNVTAGYSALHGNTTGSSNTALGYYAGRYQADGSTALADPENSVFIGAHSRGFSNADSNSIVIGYQAIGEGANTTVIGNSSTVSTHLYGQTKANSLEVNGATDLNDQVVVEAPVAPAPAVRAMRVLADGTILIKPSGDLPMGDFDEGQQP